AAARCNGYRVLRGRARARLLEHAQMLGDGRLRVSGAVGERVHGEFAVAREALEDRAAGRIGETGWHDTTHNPLVIDLSTLRHTSGLTHGVATTPTDFSHAHPRLAPLDVPEPCGSW